jgi:hypothetical protein
MLHPRVPHPAATNGRVNDATTTSSSSSFTSSSSEFPANREPAPPKRDFASAFLRVQTPSTPAPKPPGRKRHNISFNPFGKLMLYTFAVILIIAWLLGFISDFTMGGFIHLLLLIAIILIVVRLIQGKRI